MTICITLYNCINEDVKNNMNEFLFANIIIVFYLEMWFGKLHYSLKLYNLIVKNLKY